MSEEQKAKISASCKGKTAWNKGRPATEAEIKKSGDGVRRVRAERGADIAAKQSAALKGRKRSPETRARMSKAMKRRWAEDDGTMLKRSLRELEKINGI